MREPYEKPAVDQEEAVGVLFRERQRALLGPLKEEAAVAFNEWLELHRFDHPEEAAVTATEITLCETRHGWITCVDRDALEEYDCGIEEYSPVDALLRFIVWAKVRERAL